MRLVFLGTPPAAVPFLRALVDAGHDVALVVSRADKRRGRSGAPVPSAVKAAALEIGLSVTDRVDDVIEVGADLGVVVAFGRIIRPHVLAAVPMVNVHFSLLPRWRGAAPVERAILAGDERTGVCVMEVEEGLDTGGVYASREVSIATDETAEALRDRLVELGVPLLIETLDRGLGKPVSQSGEPTYAAKIEPQELEIDWTAPAREIDRVIRVGGAWTMFRGARFKIHRAKPASTGVASDGSAKPGQLEGLRVMTSDGELELIEVQPEGKARQPASAWRNGARPRPGECLGA